MEINLLVRQLVFKSSETAVGILVNSMDPELIGSSMIHARSLLTCAPVASLLRELVKPSSVTKPKSISSSQDVA